MTNPPTQLPPGKMPVLRVMPMPRDLNPAGDVFGGWIMSQVDIAGAVPARQRARGRVATIAVNSFLFKQPVSVGDIVSFYAEVLHVGKSSITVDVEVYAERNPEDPVVVKVTEAKLTYVAVSANGIKRDVPPEPVA
jgi:acyl-CoA thioesterase YciA